MNEPPQPVVLVGLFRVRGHCTFTWEEREREGRRTARVRSTHCADCVAELRTLGYLLVFDDKALSRDA